MKISWDDRMRNEEVLQRVEEDRNILQTTKRIKAIPIGYILRRNCLLKHVTEGKTEGRTEVTGTQGKGRKQLLNNLKEEGRYWELKKETLDTALWRTRCGRADGPVVRLQNA